MNVSPDRIITKSQSLFSGFMQFVLRGQVVNLAVAVLIGSAAGTLANSFVKNIFTPLITAIFGVHELQNQFVILHNSRVEYGKFLNDFTSFVLIAATVYFFVILPVNKLTSMSYFAPPPDPALRKCPECLSDIPKAARRCMHCTQPVEPLAEEPAGA